MKQEKDRWSREKKFARDMVAYYENWVDRFPKSVAAKEKLGEWKEKFNSIQEIDMEMFVLMVILAVVYFAPTIIAVRGDHKNQGAIAVLNLLLGWTFLGWVAAMVWSVAK